MDNERWRPVVGWEGFYIVSNMGRVMSTSQRKGTRPGRCLRTTANSDGYSSVILSTCPDDRKSIKVHRMVLDAFIGPAPIDQPEGNHKNGNRTDNRADNLEWVSRSGNQQHSFHVTKLNSHRAERNPFYRPDIDEDAIRAARRDTGLPYWKIAKQFGVSTTHAHRICHHKRFLEQR